MKNATFAVWTGTYILMFHNALYATSDIAWILWLLICIQMPILLYSFIVGTPKVAKLRAALIMFQFPFALLMWFRFDIPFKLFGVATTIYLLLSAIIAFRIRAEQEISKK